MRNVGSKAKEKSARSRAEPTTPTNRFVLDAFALFAFLQAEPGGPRVRELIEQAAAGRAEILMSVINFGEAIYTTEMRHGRQAAAEAAITIGQLPIELVPVDGDLALLAGRLKVGTHMGYADCFAAAIARANRATLVTGDSDFRRVEGAITIEWLPQS